MRYPGTSASFKPLMFSILLLISIALTVNSGLIPEENLIGWTPGVTVGVPGGIPTNRTRLINVTLAPYNADNTGMVDSAPAIQAAINAAISNDVVYLPAGKYRINSGLLIGPQKKYITLRGDGDNTIIENYAPTFAIKVGGDNDYLWDFPKLLINSGMQKGSTNLVVSSTAEFTPGYIINIRQANDTNLPVLHVSGYKLLRKMKAKVVSKTSASLQIWPPLYFDLKPELQPIISRASAQAEGVGIENLRINADNSQPTYLIYFRQANGCWIKDVHTHFAKAFHIYIADSLQCEVRRCNLDQMQNPGGPNGGGLMLDASSACWIEDNIIYKCFPLIEVNFGCSGNAFSYNFLEDSMAGTMSGAAIDTNHGPHNSANLYEGNISPNLQCDGYYGSTSHDVVFRNWLHGRQPGLILPSYTINLNRFTRHYAVIGNIFGCTNYTWKSSKVFLGYPNMGNSYYSGSVQPSLGIWWSNWGTTPGPTGFQELDLDVKNTSEFKGNFNYADNAIPDSEKLSDVILPDSLLYTQMKPKWFRSLQWPPFNPVNPNPQLTSIPAGYRFKNYSDPPNISGDTNPPTVPIITSAIASSQRMLRLTWTQSSDDDAVSFYKLQRSLESATNEFKEMGLTTATEYLDINFESANAYNYRLQAVDLSGNVSSYSPVYTVKHPQQVRNLHVAPLQ